MNQIDLKVEKRHDPSRGDYGLRRTCDEDSRPVDGFRLQAMILTGAASGLSNRTLTGSVARKVGL